MVPNDRNSEFDSLAALIDTGLVLIFLAVHAAILAGVAGAASRPLVLPFAVAILAGAALFVADRIRRGRGRRAAEPSRSSPAARWGVWLMGAVSVLGVANVWYAALDPARPVLPSVATFTGSLVVTAVFIVMAASRPNDSSPNDR